MTMTLSASTNATGRKTKTMSATRISQLMGTFLSVLAILGMSRTSRAVAQETTVTANHSL